MVRLIGFQPVEGTNKKGEPYSGYKIFLTDDSYSKRVIGDYCFSEYVPRNDDFSAFFSDVDIGCAVALQYNRWGRVQSIRYAEG